MTTPDPIENVIEFVLLDTDLTSALAILPAADAELYMEVNEPGSGSLSVPALSNAAGLIASGQFVRATFRGDTIGGFFIENIEETFASSGEEGDRWMKVSGRGGLALLDDAIVWDNGSSDASREFSGTKASILIMLLTEAQSRSALTTLSWDFSATLDSNGASWADDETLKFNAGISMLEVVREISSLGIDFEMLPDGAGGFVLSAYSAIGTDKSSTIYFRTGTNCEEIESTEEGADIKNVLRVQYKGGYTTVKNNTSIAARRRRESSIDAQFAAGTKAARAFGNSKLVITKDPKRQISINVYDGVKPYYIQDYGIGDAITLDKHGVETEYRIRAVRLSLGEGEKAHVALDLNSMITEHQIRMQQQIDALINKVSAGDDAGEIKTGFWAALGRNSNNGNINCMAALGSDIYIGGHFTIFGGIEANNVIKFDTVAVEFSALGEGAENGFSSPINDGDVLAVTVIGNDVFFGGIFRYAGTVDLGSGFIAKWNGSAWSALGGGLGTYCYSLANNGVDLFAGGYGAGNFIKKYSGGAWSTIGTTADSSKGCYALNYSTNGNLYAGGDFLAVSGVPVNRIAKWDGAVWTALGAGLSGPCYAITSNANSIYVGGTFDTAGGVTVNSIALYNGSWSAFGTGFTSPAEVDSIWLDGEDIYAGGGFQQSEPGVYVNSIAFYNGEGWNKMGRGENGATIATIGLISGACKSIVIVNNIVYVGGNYTLAGGKASKHFSAFIRKLEDVINNVEARGGDKYNLAGNVHGAASKTPPVNADEIPLIDSVTSYTLKKLTWANVKATLKTYFDTIYSAIVTTTRGDMIRRGAITDERFDAKTSGFIVQGNGTDAVSAAFDWDTISVAAGADMVHSHANASEGGALDLNVNNPPFFFVAGALATGTNILSIAFASLTTVESWYLLCKVTGISSSTIADINLTGTGTIFSTQANRPALAYNDADGLTISGAPSTTVFPAGSILTLDIDQVAPGAADMIIVPKVTTNAGEAFTPSHYPLPVFFPSSQTNWNNISSTGSVDYYSFSSGAQNDQIIWSVNLPAGTYTWSLLHFRATTSGIYTLYIAGASVGTVDGYGSSLIVASSVTGIVVAGGNPVEVKIKMATKNASASAYYGVLWQSWLVRTGA